MKILVIGSGAREHAIAETFHRSSHHPHVVVSPGNPGIGREFELIALESFEDIEDYCLIEGIDFVFIGPEQPIADGLSDHLRACGIKVIGPSQAAARIESSKAFAKRLMSAHNIPTSSYQFFTDSDAALNSLNDMTFPIVIKADGLASGKGVFIAPTREDATSVISKLMIEKSLCEAGCSIIIEEYLSGWEVSLFTFTDGSDYCSTIFVQDHKQLYDGDAGPNTGGMGAYAPVPEAEAYKSEIEQRIVEPVLNALISEGCPYQGVLYIGLMITPEGPKVIEFNCRMGDPETQAMLPLLDTDLVDLCQAILNRTLSSFHLRWKNMASVSVYAVSGQYPRSASVKVPVTFSGHFDSSVYYGAVDLLDNGLVTAGGRIIALSALGLSKDEARTKVYHDLSKIYFDGIHYRRDIGLRNNSI